MFLLELLTSFFRESLFKLFNSLFLSYSYGKKISTAKWLCLIPIIGGVCLAALKQNKDGSIEMDFTMGGLIGALVANVFAAFKGNESKRLMEDPTIKVASIPLESSFLELRFSLLF